MTEINKPKIVIIGSGLVGAFAGIALSKLSNIDLQIYEKTSGPREVGAWISLTEGSVAMLGNFIDLKELDKIVYRGGSSKFYTKRHWKTGEVLKIDEPSFLRLDNYSQARTHRVALHNLILSYVPEDLIQYGYEFEKAIKNGDGVNIFFKDHEKPVYADLLVSADGIYSKVRRQFTNDIVAYKGTVAYRNIFPKKLVENIPNLPDDTSCWVHNEYLMFFSDLGLNQYGMVAIVPEPPEVLQKLKWNGDIGDWGRKHLLDHFKDFDPVIIQLLDVIPEVKSFPLERAPWLKNLVINNRIAYVGDAAHPTSGAYGAGAAMGFDDVWALYKALEENSNLKEVKIADGDLSNVAYNLQKSLYLFNETRKYFLARVERQIDIDHDILCKYVHKATTENDWKIRIKRFLDGLSWIREHNVKLEFQQKRDELFLPLFTDQEFDFSIKNAFNTL